MLARPDVRRILQLGLLAVVVLLMVLYYVQYAECRDWLHEQVRAGAIRAADEAHRRRTCLRHQSWWPWVNAGMTVALLGAIALQFVRGHDGAAPGAPGSRGATA